MLCKTRATICIFYEHDMRLPFWINYFDIAFNFFTSFGYFNTQREHDNAIRTIATSLKPDGILVMDFLNVEFSAHHSVAESTQTIGSSEYHISKWFDEKHFYKKILVEDIALTKPLQYTEKVSKFSLQNFDSMFGKHGLKIKEVFGDYDFNKYNAKTSPRLIMIAKLS